MWIPDPVLHCVTREKRAIVTAWPEFTAADTAQDRPLLNDHRWWCELESPDYTFFRPILDNLHVIR